MSKTTLEKYGIIIVLYFLSTESIPMTRYPFRESVGQRLLVKTEMPPQNTSDLEPPQLRKKVGSTVPAQVTTATLTT